MRGTNKSWFAKGMRDAIPIALGYLAVSFTLGIAAKNAGFTPFQAFLVSFTNNASAGEFAGFTLIAAGGGYLEVAILILITNARYLLMSCALSQKLPPDTPMIQRLLLSYDVTDELFGISVAVPGKLNPYYSFGAYTVAHSLRTVDRQLLIFHQHFECFFVLQVLLHFPLILLAFP